MENNNKPEEQKSENQSQPQVPLNASTPSKIFTL